MRELAATTIRLAVVITVIAIVYHEYGNWLQHTLTQTFSLFPK
jgi:hypothetical protein